MSEKFSRGMLDKLLIEGLSDGPPSVPFWVTRRKG
jgi:hypothetical protein